MSSQENTSPTTPDEGRFPQPPTPAQRKRLQKCYEHANLQMRQENYDYATELFTQCVLGDPGNLLYVQGFLGNLKQKYNNNKKGDKLAFMKVLGSKGMVKKASLQKDWGNLFKSGLEILKLNPWDVSTLTALAAACEELELYDAQLVYLRLALDADPKDPNINRTCGRALGRRKLFDQAIACWHRVEQAIPGDEEAARAIASLTVEKAIDQGKYEGDAAGTKLAKGTTGDGGELTPEQRLQREIRRNPSDMSKYVELADLYLRDDQFAKAEDVLRRAFEASDNNPEIRERWEDAQLRHLRQQLAEAEKKAEQTGRPEDQRKAEQIKQQLFEKDLEFCKNRVERFPNNLAYKFDLAVRYQLVGQYKEAIAEYQQAQNDPKRKGLCMLALGQCFQAIKQYSLAMRHYETAVQEIPDRDAVNKKKALHLAGKLALALKDLDTADRCLSTLAGLDFSYKDVSALLDKIARLRKNVGEAKSVETPAVDDAGAEEPPQA
jgi:tetratricopeptide (TPR) repeat protein